MTPPENDLMHLGWNEDAAFDGWFVRRTYCDIPVHRARVGGMVTCLLCMYMRQVRWDSSSPETRAKCRW